MATATAEERSRLRRQAGLDKTKLPDTEINQMFTEAEEMYPVTTYSRSVWFAAVRLQVAKDMMAEAAQRVSHSQGQSQTSLSDRFRHMKDVVAMYESDLEKLISKTVQLPLARWGRTKTVPSRTKEYPDG